MKNHYTLYIYVCLILFATCKKGDTEQSATITDNEPTLFTLLAPEKTHIDFQNNITEGLNTNVLMYEYFYNGGGVAVGDINNDGLDDIYFTSNMEANRLYLNKGNMVFEDITASAGVAGRSGPWKTGVTMADVNGDGFLDIYVCHSGNLSPEKRMNELFINQGNSSSGSVRFIEKAADYGLNSPATSTQATFFDYDKDGDLDMFLLNHNPKSLPVLDEATTAEFLKKDDPINGMRFFRQDTRADANGKSKSSEPIFRDITQQAGLQSSALSYGLGAAMADFNGDGWTDMYISNDYTIPDFLYINNKKGGFINKIGESVGHTSQFSMGSDAADINNDALVDMFTLDMLPEDNKRQKLLMAPDNYEKFDFNVKVGFGQQYMRNMLHINQGMVNNELTFSEVGQLAGISNTDWSWSALFADYDNDGWKDLYITNGYLRDYTNLDFLKYMNDYMQSNRNIQRQNVLELVQKIPASNLTNYMFKNKAAPPAPKGGDERIGRQNSPSGGWGGFQRLGWGTAKPSNSNGAAYADLDNDGDLDLIVNNINNPAFIYQNEANTLVRNHFLKIKLQGDRLNKLGLGAKITLYNTPSGGKGTGKMQYLEQMPTRGYQSSVSPILHFGLGQNSTIDSLKITWQSGKQEILKSITGDKLIVLEEKNAINITQNAQNTEGGYFNEIISPIVFDNPKNTINDFKRQPLLTNPLSQVSPCMAKGDINNDGLEDVYVGGLNDLDGRFFIQNKNGTFKSQGFGDFPGFTSSTVGGSGEQSDAAFFDANGDGFLDLYVCHGGYGLANTFQDCLYLNNGQGYFGEKLANGLPQNSTSKSCVRVTDINGDGKPDLFVGGRVVAGRYPEAPLSSLLINDGKGNFSDQTATLAPALQKIGMITDAAWIDLNNDKKPELIVVGEFMPITVFGLQNGTFQDVTSTYFDKKYSGLWQKILLEDINNDGKADLIVGNMGLNTQLKASDKEPAELYFKDFDDNGSIDPILCFYNQGKSYPYITRDELLDQMSIMRARFPDYKSYAEASLNTVFTKDELKGATRLEANTLKTSLFIFNGQKFEEKPLPIEVQSSPIFAINTLDFDKDGKKDLIFAGNMTKSRLKFGKYDANYGLLLRGDGQGNFSTVPQAEAGFRLKGDVRSVLNVNNMVLFGVNQQGVKAYKMK